MKYKATASHFISVITQVHLPIYSETYHNVNGEWISIDDIEEFLYDSKAYGYKQNIKSQFSRISFTSASFFSNVRILLKLGKQFSDSDGVSGILCIYDNTRLELLFRAMSVISY